MIYESSNTRTSYLQTYQLDLCIYYQFICLSFSQYRKNKKTVFFKKHKNVIMYKYIINLLIYIAIHIRIRIFHRI